MKYILVDDGKTLKIHVDNGGGIYAPLCVAIGNSSQDVVGLVDYANRGVVDEATTIGN